MIRLYCDFCKNEISETHLMCSDKLLHWKLTVLPSDYEKRIVTDGDYQICRDCRNKVLQLRKKKEELQSFSRMSDK